APSGGAGVGRLGHDGGSRHVRARHHRDGWGPQRRGGARHRGLADYRRRSCRAHESRRHHYALRSELRRPHPERPGAGDGQGGARRARVLRPASGGAEPPLHPGHRGAGAAAAPGGVRRVTLRIVKPAAVLAILAAALAGAVVVATAMGTVPLPYGETARIVFSRLLGVPADVSPAAEAIVWNVRLPRVVAAGLVGLALGVGGAAMQALFKNPLASPDLIGVSTGGALGAVAAIFLGWTLISPWLMPLTAFAGALAVAALVYALSTRAG